jgi:predicted cobalt transporter CbtA
MRVFRSGWEGLMRIAGFAIIILAAVIGIVPQLTDCFHEGVAGTCHWTAQAALASAVPLAVLGAMCGFGKSRSTRRSLSVIGVIVAVFVILLPTYLIGVCSSDAMRCNIIMKPTLIMAGLIVAALCATMFLASRKGVDAQ